MNKKRIALGLAGLLLVLSACKDLSTPSDTLGTAFTAVQKGELEDLRETLTPDLRLKYGTLEGLGALRNVISPYKDLTVRDETLTRVEKGDQGYGRHGDILRVFVDVVVGKSVSDGAEAKVLTATLSCGVKAVRKQGPDHCRTRCRPRGDCDTTCRPGRVTIEESQTCQIAELAL